MQGDTKFIEITQGKVHQRFRIVLVIISNV